jgi:serine phosphatase RsbU (regulator of sigma subunit)
VQTNVGAQTSQDLPARHKLSAQGVQAALMTEIHGFVSDAPQFDDITLIVVVRE